MAVRAAGLMSGTSADGVDAAIVDIGPTGGGRMLQCPAARVYTYETSIGQPMPNSDRSFYYLLSAYAIIPGYRPVPWGGQTWFGHPPGMGPYVRHTGLADLTPDRTVMVFDYNWGFSADVPWHGNHDHAGSGGVQAGGGLAGQNVGFLDGHVAWVRGFDMRTGWRNHERVYIQW